MRTYKIRTVWNDKQKGQSAYAIGMPREMGERFLALTFNPEITDEGILFRPVLPDTSKIPPAWAGK